MTSGIDDGFVEISNTKLEFRRLISYSRQNRPTLVFLHEGLGSVSTWRDFPDQLSRLTGLNALVYSRAGYGKSDPASLPRPIEYLRDEAQILGEILERLSIRETILVGHSDGASIALIYAGRYDDSDLKGIILEAPHVFTEPSMLKSIAQIADVYRTTDLRDRLAKHHGANTDNAFWGWNDVWLHPDYQAWNIESVLPTIRAPALAIQGEDDQYGTWSHIEAIEQSLSAPVETLAVPNCGHAPHHEHPEIVLAAMEKFISKV